ncbi:MAG: cyclic nucleotide-binding domain-containing protein [Pseudobutyrivibrio sp.]|nr:cyclic nucleotide-binding domain-containing protein [Pseudobutyrivibrio sp.]
MDDNNVKGKDKIFVAPEGMKIIVEGQPDSYMYIILSGRAHMYIGHGTKDEKLVDKFGPGSCFGAYGMLTKRPDIYTVVAMTAMKIIRLQEDDLVDFVKDNPTNILHLTKGLANDMVRMKSEIQELNNELTERKRKAGELVTEPESIVLKDNSGTHRIYNPKNPHFDSKGKMRFLGREK